MPADPDVNYPLKILNSHTLIERAQATRQQARELRRAVAAGASDHAEDPDAPAWRDPSGRFATDADSIDSQSQ